MGSAPGSNLVANLPAASLLAGAAPSQTTLHFTFGSLSMLDFLHNWKHSARPRPRAGARRRGRRADAEGPHARGHRGGRHRARARRGITRWRTRASTVVREGAAEWEQTSQPFLEFGLAAPLELLLGYDVLISDLDVVWINDGWERWMTYRSAARPPPRRRRAIRPASGTDELTAVRRP